MVDLLPQDKEVLDKITEVIEGFGDWKKARSYFSDYFINSLEHAVIFSRITTEANNKTREETVFEKGRLAEAERTKKEIEETFMGSVFENLPARILSNSNRAAYCIGCQETEAAWEKRVKCLKKRLEVKK